MNKSYGIISIFFFLIAITCFSLTCVESPRNEEPVFEPEVSRVIEAEVKRIIEAEVNRDVEAEGNEDATPVKVVLPGTSPRSGKDYVPAGIRKEAKEGSLEYVDVRFSVLEKGADVVEIWLGHDIGFVTAVKRSFKITKDKTYIWRGFGSGGGLSDVCFAFSKRLTLGGTISIRYRNRSFQVNSIKWTSHNILWEVNFDALPPFRDITLTEKDIKKRHKSLKKRNSLAPEKR